MAKESVALRSFLLGVLLLASPLCVRAQLSESIPPSPAYKGEIRRGADGRLMVLEAADPLGSRTDAPAKPATMVVGSQEKITTISEAAKLAQDGEVIEIRPGDYRGQAAAAVWTRDNLVIRGAGARPVMIADGKSAAGKALWVVSGGKVRIENIEFRGARLASGDGAAIRFERGDLVVSRCAFFDTRQDLLPRIFRK